ncbi:MAG: thioredoxin [Firmicutes bacterium]|uniref:Thioredoxin n=1 Tax=Candidatus Onthovivens merdipullorum TaxID=2840889 RepID=A0A9D9DGL2_9BACL|nr:thioredoxin [Candidatus Onthovivens merdipullorum]
MVIELDLESKFNELIKEGLVLVDFNATWCGPCRMLKPEIEALSEERKDVKFVSVDVDNFNALSARYNVRVVPTLVLFKDGKVIEVTTGYRPKESLNNFLSNR